MLAYGATFDLDSHPKNYANRFHLYLRKNYNPKKMVALVFLKEPFLRALEFCFPSPNYITCSKQRNLKKMLSRQVNVELYGLW
jgi:hypothetical protein